MSGLKRDLGLADAVGVGLGAIIGAGIFVVAGRAAGIAGSGLLIALVIAGAAAACNGLSTAALAARYPTSGGVYEYGYELLNPWAGFAAGWLFLVSKASAGAVAASALGSSVAMAFPGIPPQAGAAAVVAAMAAANWIGIKKTGWLNLAIVAITIGSLLAFVIAAIPAADWSTIKLSEGVDWQSIAAASALVFFCYTGYARIATLAEEVKEPETTIPRAVVCTIVISVGLYVVVAACMLATLDQAVLRGSEAPLLMAAEALGTWPARAVFVGSLFALAGVLLSQVLGMSRVVLAMARRDDLPSGLAAVHEQTGIPRRAVAAVSGLVLVLALVFPLDVMTASAAFSILLYYTLANISALRLAPGQTKLPRWVSWLGLAFCLALAASIPWQSVLAGLGVLGVGAVIRLGRRQPGEAAG